MLFETLLIFDETGWWSSWLAVNKFLGGKECVVLVAVVISDEHIRVSLNS